MAIRKGRVPKSILDELGVDDLRTILQKNQSILIQLVHVLLKNLF